MSEANVNGGWVGVGSEWPGEGGTISSHSTLLKISCGKKGTCSDRFFPHDFLTGLEWEERGPRPARSDRERRHTTPTQPQLTFAAVLTGIEVRAAPR